MPEIIRTKLAGVSFANRQRLIAEEVYEDCYLLLEREPDNPNGSNAIAVFVGLDSDENTKIGYISSDLSARYAPLMDTGQIVDASVLQVTGQDQGTLGVNIELKIFSPEESAEIKERTRQNYSTSTSIQTPSIAPIPTSIPTSIPILTSTPISPSTRKNTKSSKNIFILLLLWFFLGYLGVHRWYAGRGSWLYTLTLGYFLIGWMIDLVVIILGQFKDGRGKYIHL